MKSWVFCGVLILVAACGETDNSSLAAAQASDEGPSLASTKSNDDMPAVAQKWVVEKARECRADGNEFKGLSDAVRKFDFNGDGVEDYALWEGGLACEGRDASYFGNAGGQVSFVVSENGSHKLHDGFSIFGWDSWNVQKQSGKDTLLMQDGDRQVLWGWNGKTIAMSRRSATLRCTWESEGGDGKFEISIAKITPGSISGSWSGEASVRPRKENNHFAAAMIARGSDDQIVIGKGGKASIDLYANDGSSAYDWQGSINFQEEMEDGSEELYEVALGCYN